LLRPRPSVVKGGGPDLARWGGYHGARAGAGELWAPA
jgi:hypothetical protein